ncbi:PucR family transcriptional regulator [Patulibacter defluvii]|uniref:PucR family transcriptional regulator n=1 Tax=Patulibacter defluvii TaxID=3095358 RepID=UPI002A751AE1|nr:helix-turn-helix domain-containing protein [Patulibacter sp. DM4]
MEVEDDQRQSLLAAVAHRLPDVVANAARRAKRELPEYERIDEREIAAGIAADLARGMAAMVEGRPLTDDERAAMGTIGDTRARQRVPMEAMLRVYRFTIDEIFSLLWEESRDGRLDHGQVLGLMRDVWRYADPMMDVAVSSYRHRELRQTVADSQRRTALVHSVLLTPGGTSSAAALASWVTPGGRFVALRARHPDGDARELLLDLQVPGALEDAAVAPYEDDIVGFAAARPTIVPAPGVVIGVGPAVALGDLPRSFAIASRVVKTAAAFGRSGVLALADLPLEALALADADVAGELLARYVAPLAGAGEVLDTVRAYLAHDLAVEPTARALFVHANTVRNRLHRYEQATGASLRSPAALTGIELALRRAALEQRAE